ncbi:hypothetical protein SAMN05216298_0497 [Glycomyces sambucus]|uniref:Prephenate dehydratase n=1 Tax=Glycomyces sambucus TaxID=380244 RepID=A0A1G9CSS7_9ACTN|nr:bacilysin biosynthesis protein BacA [Glycomyces sambucus]SDK54771.1 hypothetical protein SAMN05216298_0497 [Glycomyces sambucus]
MNLPDWRLRLRRLHTLGPAGTNLEAAARDYAERSGPDVDVVLHASIEDAMVDPVVDGTQAIVACAVYPELHTLVFSNLHRLRMVDSFLMPTHNMVLAARGAGQPRTVATHPAPAQLVADRDRTLVTSNAQAAIDCANGLVDGCVTTIVAAERHRLRVVTDFGPVPMIFTVHLLSAP